MENWGQIMLRNVYKMIDRKKKWRFRIRTWKFCIWVDWGEGAWIVRTTTRVGIKEHGETGNGTSYTSKHNSRSLRAKIDGGTPNGHIWGERQWVALGREQYLELSWKVERAEELCLSFSSCIFIIATTDWEFNETLF